MNQEDEKLLLIDLSSRLSYGVFNTKIKIYTFLYFFTKI